ncbi:MAG: hypothetical protein ABI091_16940, partial [Ferruginibacter sp.]
VDNYNNLDADFKTFLEAKLAFLLCIGMVIYFFIQPRITYDNANFYIKKVAKKEIIIPLQNINSIFDKPFYATTRFFKIEFTDQLHEADSIQFNVSLYSDKMPGFINAVKEKNPHVEIV